MSHYTVYGQKCDSPWVDASQLQVPPALQSSVEMLCRDLYHPWVETQCGCWILNMKKHKDTKSQTCSLDLTIQNPAHLLVTDFATPKQRLQEFSLSEIQPYLAVIDATRTLHIGCWKLQGQVIRRT